MGKTNNKQRNHRAIQLFRIFLFSQVLTLRTGIFLKKCVLGLGHVLCVGRMASEREMGHRGRAGISDRVTRPQTWASLGGNIRANIGKRRGRIMGRSLWRQQVPRFPSINRRARSFSMSLKKSE